MNIKRTLALVSVGFFIILFIILIILFQTKCPDGYRYDSIQKKCIIICPPDKPYNSTYDQCLDCPLPTQQKGNDGECRECGKEFPLCDGVCYDPMKYICGCINKNGQFQNADKCDIGAKKLLVSTTKLCGANICKSSQVCDFKSLKCVDCPNDICSGQCCTSNQKCISGQCCNIENIHDNKCCTNWCQGPNGAGTCCKSGFSCDSTSGKCNLCGDTPCSKETDSCVLIEKTGQKYCYDAQCQWQDSIEDPPSIVNKDSSVVPIYKSTDPTKLMYCGDGGTRTLSYVSKTCSEGNCEKLVDRQGISSVTFSQDTLSNLGTCKGIINSVDCSRALVPDIPKHRVCKNQNGDNDGSFCKKGTCGTDGGCYTFSCVAGRPFQIPGDSGECETADECNCMPPGTLPIRIIKDGKCLSIRPNGNGTLHTASLVDINDADVGQVFFYRENGKIIDFGAGILKVFQLMNRNGQSLDCGAAVNSCDNSNKWYFTDKDDNNPWRQYIYYGRNNMGYISPLTDGPFDFLRTGGGTRGWVLDSCGPLNKPYFISMKRGDSLNGNQKGWNIEIVQ